MIRDVVDQALQLARWSFEELRHFLVRPPYVVRLYRRRQEFRSIISDAVNGAPPWQDNLVERVVQHILGKDGEALSVYEVIHSDPLDVGHALGVIAEGIAQKDFQITAKNRKKADTRGTLLIPTTHLPPRAQLKFTPQNNLNFSPANNHHYDLSVSDMRELACTILDGIHTKAIRWTFLAKENESYRLQAVIAYSYCLLKFGTMDHLRPPLGWHDGKPLKNSEQIEILKHLTRTSDLDKLET